MAKIYSKASTDVMRTIQRMREEYHQELHVEDEFNVTIDALFVFDEEAGGPVLKHQGYGAAAVVKITNLKERTLGLADVLIEVDRYHWQTLTPAQRDALIDHELQHVELALDEETGNPTFDALGRPKLQTRLHDAQIGVFHEVMRRHGTNSIEARQMRTAVFEASQYNLELFPQVKVDGETGEVVGSFTTRDGTKVEMRGSGPVAGAAVAAATA